MSAKLAFKISWSFEKTPKIIYRVLLDRVRKALFHLCSLLIYSENGLINLIKLVNCPRINKFKRRSNVLINMIARLSKQCREKGNAQKRIEDELRESEMLDLPGWSKFKRSDWLTKSFKDLARFTLMN